MGLSWWGRHGASSLDIVWRSNEKNNAGLAIIPGKAIPRTIKNEYNNLLQDKSLLGIESSINFHHYLITKWHR